MDILVDFQGGQIKILSSLLGRFDLDLLNCLNELGIYFEHFAFRWLSLLLAREFKLPGKFKCFIKNYFNLNYTHIYIYIYCLIAIINKIIINKILTKVLYELVFIRIKVIFFDYCRFELSFLFGIFSCFIYIRLALLIYQLLLAVWLFFLKLTLRAFID